MNSTDSTKENITFCGFPPFCSLDAIQECEDLPLQDCPLCSEPLATATLSFLIILGVLIILGNAFVIFVILWNKYNSGISKRDCTKVSLAVADVVKGLDVLAVSVPHLLTTKRLTAKQLHDTRLLTRGSISATLGGTTSLFVFNASVLHLLYMSIQRFIAIKYPLKYRRSTLKSTVAHLVVIWVLSLLVSSIPGWGIHQMSFTYNAEIFQYYFAFDSSPARDTITIALIACQVVPYFIIITLLLLSSREARVARINSRLMRAHRVSHAEVLAEETRAFKLNFMIFVGFTVTFVPEIVFLFLMFFEQLNCENLSTPSFVCFYMATSSGLSDVVVYSIHDRSFRKTLCSHFKSTKRKSVVDSLNSRLHTSSMM